MKDVLHPFLQYQDEDGTVPCCFGRKWWTVYCFDEADILRTIKYVQNNPLKAGHKPQAWPFVMPYPARRPV